MNIGLHLVLAVAALLPAASMALAQTRPATPPARTTTKVADSNLEAVLTQMDKAADSFRSAQADFIWDQYQMVVDETDTQKGSIYFRRHGKETDMAADVKAPEPKYILFADNKLRLYQPRIDQITEYHVGKNRNEFESFLVLGFGGRGHDLLRSFNVKLVKREMVDGVNTALLELVPIAPRVRNMFERMLLWIDPVRGVSVKQQFFEPSGDHRLAHYVNIKLNQKIDDDAFKLKSTGRTKTVTPQG
jgi:outer membrane lipoprotein-sorting protein